MKPRAGDRRDRVSKSMDNTEALRRGGGPGVRDAGLLESAVGQAKASFGGQWLHPDVFAMAAAYALGAALMFLDLNGVELDDPEEQLYDAMIAVSARTLDKPGLARLSRDLAAATANGLVEDF